MQGSNGSSSSMHSDTKPDLCGKEFTVSHAAHEKAGILAETTFHCLVSQLLQLVSSSLAVS